MKNIAFLGLGVMGYPMAGHIKQHGYAIDVWNRTTAKAKKWERQYQAQRAHTIGDAVRDKDIVCMCLGNDDDVRSVACGDNGAIANMRAGSLLIDHTTTSSTLARSLQAEAKQRNVRFLDAPVSGGQSGAEQGTLTVMVGGDSADYQRAIALLECYAAKHVHIGTCGEGQLTKMVNQICIAGVLQGLSEALVFAKEHDLDCNKVLDAIGKGAAQSWQMNNRGHTMVNNEFAFGFAVRWMIKDLQYCIHQARHNDVHLPLTENVLAQYIELAKQGGGHFDTSSLINSVAKIAKNQ